ncbi:helix-turn-helix transcriptional regulator [Flavobacterium filum]|uniref:helix-turn-helix domain-containing protein n=1 Tax=Flavobacterium filum TaxID=370974 RepID=UPI0023F2B3F7|nr:helix-turn-helix transcriptional regulator [Flavobacterium filum]
MKNNIGQKIRKVRELKGFTQEYMADKLAISQRAYSKLENNETKLNWEKIEIVSSVLGVDPLELVTFDDNMVFNNCTQSGKQHTFNYNFSEELKKNYEERIEHLEKEIEFLRDLVKKSNVK